MYTTLPRWQDGSVNGLRKMQRGAVLRRKVSSQEVKSGQDHHKTDRSLTNVLPAHRDSSFRPESERLRRLRG